MQQGTLTPAGSLRRDRERTHEAQKKILLCGPPMTAIGGGPTHMRNMFTSPLKQHYQLILFEAGSRGSTSPAADESTTAALGRLLAGPWMFAWRMLRSRPDVVHINSALLPKAFWRDAIFLAIAKLFRRRVVLQFHGGSVRRLATRRLGRRLVGAVLKRADALVVLGSSAQQELRHFGLDDKVVVIPNSVDVSVYQAVPRRHSGKINRIAYLGRLVGDKGLLEAIEALRILRDEKGIAGLELHIAGSGPMQAQIERYIARRGLTECVVMRGSVSGQDKVAFLSGSDVFLLPSYHEGLPYSVLESLAAGTPVIATAVGDIPDVVTHGVHGWLIPPRDPGAIADAVLALGADARSLRQMSIAAGAWSRDNLSLDRLCRQFSRIYEQLSSQAD